MPVLRFFLDHLGRPVIDLAISISSTDRATQPADAVFLPWPVTALVDTGAGRSQVDVHALQSLGISPSTEISIFTASTGATPESMWLYPVDLIFPGDPPGLLARDIQVVGSDRLAGIQVDMLLGRDVLDRCLLVYDGAGRRFTLADNPPPPFDQV